MTIQHKPSPLSYDLITGRGRTVSDLTNRICFFKSSTSPSLIWVKLEGLNFEESAPVMKLDLVNKPDYIGDVKTKFKPSKVFSFIPEQ